MFVCNDSTSTWQEVAIIRQDIVYIIRSTQNYYNRLDSEKLGIKGLLKHK